MRLRQGFERTRETRRGDGALPTRGMSIVIRCRSNARHIEGAEGGGLVIDGRCRRLIARGQISLVDRNGNEGDGAFCRRLSRGFVASSRFATVLASTSAIATGAMGMVSPRRFGDSATCDSSSSAPEFPSNQTPSSHRNRELQRRPRSRASSANAMQHRPYRLQRVPIRFKAPRRGHRRNVSVELEGRTPLASPSFFSGRLKPRGEPPACERAVRRARSVQEMIGRRRGNRACWGILNVVDGTAHVHRPRRSHVFRHLSSIALVGGIARIHDDDGSEGVERLRAALAALLRRNDNRRLFRLDKLA